jgi:hypothetical protein
MGFIHLVHRENMQSEFFYELWYSKKISVSDPDLGVILVGWIQI